MRTRASAVSGYVRSTRRSLTDAASAAEARRGEIAMATSRTAVPAGTLRPAPSGSVTVTWLMAVLGSITTRGRLHRVAAPILWTCSHRPVVQAATSAGGRGRHGRHGRTRTADLLRVRQAL